jgi:hypothetical protein
VYCQHLKDEQGFRAFSIVNAATGKAMQHRISQSPGYPVCDPYSLPDKFV